MKELRWQVVSLIIALVLLLSGCVKDGAPPKASNQSIVSPMKNISPEKRCLTDSDCVLVDMGGCCGWKTCFNSNYTPPDIDEEEEEDSYVTCSCASPPVACRCLERECLDVNPYKPRDVNDCGYVRDSVAQKRCYSYVALEELNVSICEMIPEIRNQLICKMQLATGTGDLRFCERTGLLKDACIFRLAYDNHSILNSVIMDPYPLDNYEILNDTSLFYIQDQFKTYFTEFDQGYNPYERKEQLIHILLTPEKRYLHRVERFGPGRADFLVGNLSSAVHQGWMKVMKYHNDYYSHFFPSWGLERDVWGTFLFSENHSRALFQLYNGLDGEQTNILFLFGHSYEPIDAVSYGPNIDFCYEMYNFSFYVGGYDLIAFYKDTCIYDVAVELNSSKICVHIDDEIIGNICYDALQ